jgi:hypothetical protein
MKVPNGLLIVSADTISSSKVPPLLRGDYEEESIRMNPGDMLNRRKDGKAETSRFNKYWVVSKQKHVTGYTNDITKSRIIGQFLFPSRSFDRLKNVNR